MKTLHLRVLTPQGVILDRQVEAVKIPLADGWLGILPGHAPFQGRLMRGQLVFRDNGQEQSVATLGGTVSLSEESVAVLTGAAVLDASFEALRNELGEEIEQVQRAEQEAEKHFDRVYRSMADTFSRRRSRFRS